MWLLILRQRVRGRQTDREHHARVILSHSHTLAWRSNVSVARIGQNHTILDNPDPKFVGTAFETNGYHHLAQAFCLLSKSSASKLLSCKINLWNRIYSGLSLYSHERQTWIWKENYVRIKTFFSTSYWIASSVLLSKSWQNTEKLNFISDWLSHSDYILFFSFF